VFFNILMGLLRKMRRWYKAEFDKGIALKMYQEGMSYRAIALSLGIDRSTVSRGLHAVGCENLPKKRNPFDVVEAHKMYMGCVNISEICKKFGVSVAYLYTSFRSGGYEVCCPTERTKRRILNSPVEHQKYFDVHERYMNGESLDSLCGDVGVSVSCLYNRFRLIGLKVCDNFESHKINKNRIIASKRWNSIGVSLNKAKLDSVDWISAHKRYMECKSIETVAKELGVCEACVSNNFARLGLYVRSKVDVIEDRKKDGSYYVLYSEGRRKLVVVTSPLQIKLHKAIPESILEYPYPPYFLDIAIPSLSIDIECDGEEHRTSKQVVLKDFRRDKFMKESGWAVFRFTYDEIENSFDDCVCQVMNEILLRKHINKPSQRSQNE